MLHAPGTGGAPAASACLRHELSLSPKVFAARIPFITPPPMHRIPLRPPADIRGEAIDQNGFSLHT